MWPHVLVQVHQRNSSEDTLSVPRPAPFALVVHTYCLNNMHNYLCCLTILCELLELNTEENNETIHVLSSPQVIWLQVVEFFQYMIINEVPTQKE
jgi:hypothetical protein